MGTPFTVRPETCRVAPARRGGHRTGSAPLGVGDLDSGGQPVFLIREPGGRVRASARRRFVAAPRVRSSGGALDIRASQVGGRSPHSLAHHGLLRFPADRIHKGVVEALCPGVLELNPDEADDWVRRTRFATRSGRDRLGGTLGFRSEPSEAVRTLLDSGSPLAIKAHFALWARLFAETGGSPSGEISLSLSRFCDDLGFARLKNGAHRPQHKRQAAALLELLTTLELEAEYRAPDGRTCRLRGSVWRRIAVSGNEPGWTVAPGAWFGNPLWREFNAAVGLVGEGLLKLRQDRDRWTICLAGYLAPLARMNGYRPSTLRMETLLERTGLSRAERRNPARQREALERALDRCVEAELIGAWDFAAGSSAEPDMDSPSELRALAAAAEALGGRCVFIHWPPALRARETSLQQCRDRHRRNGRGPTRRAAKPAGG